MSRQLLELRTGQQLTLTPALQQSLRILQLSTLDLEAEVARALAENPLLESQTQDLGTAEKPLSGEVGPTLNHYEPAVAQIDNGQSSEVNAVASEPQNDDSDYGSTTLSVDFKSARDSSDDDQDVRPETAVQGSLREIGRAHV